VGREARDAEGGRPGTPDNLKKPAGPEERALLDAQIRYYRARALEYDATSAPPDDPFAPDADRIRLALREFAPRGRVLELAAGTGQWTGLLAEYAQTVRAVDASPEMLRLNAEKTRDQRVEYVVRDVFAIEPDATWDVVFFGFWLSHVPRSRFTSFWDLVRGSLAPGGRVFFVDEAGLWDEDWIDESSGVVRRRLSDGTEHRAVKVRWEPNALERRLRDEGWDVEVLAAGPFYWGAGSPS
jgi:SAM-dependent methyltransferase